MLLNIGAHDRLPSWRTNLQGKKGLLKGAALKPNGAPAKKSSSQACAPSPATNGVRGEEVRSDGAIQGGAASSPPAASSSPAAGSVQPVEPRPAAATLAGKPHSSAAQAHPAKAAGSGGRGRQLHTVWSVALVHDQTRGGAEAGRQQRSLAAPSTPATGKAAQAQAQGSLQLAPPTGGSVSQVASGAILVCGCCWRTQQKVATHSLSASTWTCGAPCLTVLLLPVHRRAAAAAHLRGRTAV